MLTRLSTRPTTAAGITASARAAAWALIALAASTGCGRAPSSPTEQRLRTSASSTAQQATAVSSSDEARGRIVSAVAALPADPQPLFELAMHDEDAGRLPDAEAELVQLRSRFPKYAPAAYELGALYLRQGRNEAALAPLTAAAALAPSNVDVQSVAGLAALRLGRYAAAAERGRAAARLAPASPTPWLLLARVYSVHGTARQAETALNRYMLFSHNGGPGCYLRGRFYYRRADARNAEKWLRLGLQSDANNPDAWVVLGHVLADLSGDARLAEGIECYRRALTISPQDGEAHAALGRALLRQGHPQEAAAHLRTAIGLTSDPGPLLYSLGQALRAAGEPQEAAHALAEFRAYQAFRDESAKLTRAIASEPRSRAPRYALARLCLANRQYRAANRVLTEASAALGPDEELRSLIQAARSGTDGPPAPVGRAAHP